MTSTVKGAKQDFLDVYYKKLKELNNPQKIDGHDLLERVRKACQEIGLPEIRICSVDENNLWFSPACGIVREDSLPFPERKEEGIDIAYIVNTSGYMSVRSVQINPWAFDDRSIMLFRYALANQGLIPEIHNIYELSVDQEEIQKINERFQNRNPRYRLEWSIGQQDLDLTELLQAKDLPILTQATRIENGDLVISYCYIPGQKSPIYSQYDEGTKVLHIFVENQAHHKYGSAASEQVIPLPQDIKKIDVHRVKMLEE